jgi:hypothetical protein
MEIAGHTCNPHPLVLQALTEQELRIVVKTTVCMNEEAVSIFGSDYPPGCHSVPGDENDMPCLICGLEIDECICPECSECGTIGDPHCYAHHGLTRTKAQIDSLAEQERRWAQAAADESAAIQTAYGNPPEL